ncbi:recombinase family protein, partial [Brevundimonas sp.]|uniref:recombinase family protein n=1 Tax=Brevundimonas sp. TaxID=1871086 RepID=UPI003D6CC104
MQQSRLDAQREACAAYITSQRHEGWVLVADAYEDGGYSGGSMERPALQQLLADISVGRIDIIVVYKVDRLTRSLADFAKIVEVLDGNGASFVSVTQAFNTTTSMGRLTLNVLLSFAQFEREVTSERIRDKIAASKAKGMWMGGPVPLGYDLGDRKLVINEVEAATVRRIFALYLESPSLRDLADRLKRDGVRSKVRVYASGYSRGGVVMSRGSLQQMLRNPIYRGMVAHKGKTFPGEHAPVVDEELWDRVQRKLEGAAVERRSGGNAREPSLLVGLVIDQHDRPMSPSHAVKGAKRYRYYVTHVDHQGDRAAWRVPAHDLERLVIDRVCTWLEDRPAIADLIADVEARDIAERIAEAGVIAGRLKAGTASERRKLLRSMVTSIILRRDRVELVLGPRILIHDHNVAASIRLEAG